MGRIDAQVVEPLLARNASGKISVEDFHFVLNSPVVGNIALVDVEQKFQLGSGDAIVSVDIGGGKGSPSRHDILEGHDVDGVRRQRFVSLGRVNEYVEEHFDDLGRVGG